MRAVNAQGHGTPSTEIEATPYDESTPQPGAPKDLRATPGDRQVTLNWKTPSHTGASAITRYEYQHTTTGSAFDDTWTEVSGTTVTISSLTGATSYTFRVRAVNGEGESYPTQVSVTPYDGPTPEPGAPTNLRATSGDHQVTLSWETPRFGASPITGYEYQYRTTSVPFDENTWTFVSGTTATVSNLVGATAYFFRVRAVNTQGAGAPSAEEEAIAYDGPTADPGVPPNLMATSGDHQVTLSWGASSAGASAITHYEYQYRTTSGTFGQTWTEVSGGESARQVTVSSLDGITTYFFRVRAVNAQGAGAPSAEEEAITYDGPTAEPGVPPNLTATPGDRQVTLSWEASSAGVSAITHYEYQYSTTSSTFGQTWTEVPGGGTTITISGLILATPYFFRVRAVNAQGAGAPSAEEGAIAYDGPTAGPGQPTNLTAAPGDHQELPSGLTELGGSQHRGCLSDHSLRISVQYDKWYIR